MKGVTFVYLWVFFFFVFVSGLRCLRIMILMQLPEILQLIKVLRTSNGIKLTSLLTIVAGAWLTSAGIFHLVRVFSRLVDCLIGVVHWEYKKEGLTLKNKNGQRTTRYYSMKYQVYLRI